MNTLENIFYINLKKNINKTGTLIAIDYEEDLNFNIKRSFIVTASKNAIRGNHAHKELNQFLICLNGSCEITCKDGVKEKKFLLENPNKALFVPNQIWASQKYLSNQSILLVLCDDKYIESDYLREYELFKTFRNNFK